MTVRTLPRPATPSAWGVDRVHVVQHGVEALVGDMPEPIDIVREPGKPAREGGREDMDLGCCVDDRTRRTRQLVHVSDGGIGDEEEPRDRRSAVLRVRLGCADVRAVHGWLLAISYWGITSTASPTWLLR